MIDKISIIGLWNERNYRIDFVDGSLIIVGENGSGKTTVLRIIYRVLSRNWIQLHNEDFVRIELKSGEDEIHIESRDMKGLEDYLINIRSDFKDSLPRSLFKDLLKDCGEWTTPEKLLKFCKRSYFPDSYISKIERIAELKKSKIPINIQKANEWIEKHNELPIIYLPTYRRSEKYHKKIDFLDNLDDLTSQIQPYGQIPYIEVAKEGMTDVDKTITRKIFDIKTEYAKSSFELSIQCFKGILTREYEDVKAPINEYMDPESISMMFSNISGADVFVENKAQIEEQLLTLLTKNGDYEEYDKIVAYFYKKLIERYEHLKKVEEPLEAFFYTCNKYLSNKKIQYYPNDFNYKIELEQGNKEKKRSIDLNHLSSGEKQLVSLFSYIYLSTPKKCMVIIDEPEISLSIEWQESILEDIKQSGKCGSLIVATQSPFVYNNSLQPLAKSLDSFLTVE